MYLSDTAENSLKQENPVTYKRVSNNPVCSSSKLFAATVAHSLPLRGKGQGQFMDVSRILSEIDAEITRLQQARTALTGIAGSGTVAPRRGRPKGSTNKATPKAGRKRNLSPEGRKRIAEAMKRRWAERRATASKGSKKESK